MRLYSPSTSALVRVVALGRSLAGPAQPRPILVISPNQQCRLKSRKSSAQYIDPHAADPTDVPVLHTRGKKAQAPRSKRGGDADPTDPHLYKTSVRNQELPGEAFDFQAVQENMKRAVERCRATVAGLVGSFGRADPALLDAVKVEYPGTAGAAKTTHPLRDFATVGVRDGSLIVTCFDPDMVKHIERAIYSAELGLTPQTQAGQDENVIRLPVPKPTSETRQAMVKDITRICENARVSIRSARHSALKQIKSDIDRKVIGKNEGEKESKSIETETKKSSAEVDALFEKNRKNLLSAV